MSGYGLELYDSSGNLKLSVSDGLTRLIEERTYTIPYDGSVYVPIPQQTQSERLLLFVTFRWEGSAMCSKVLYSSFTEQRLAGFTLYYGDAQYYPGTTGVYTVAFIGS